MCEFRDFIQLFLAPRNALIEVVRFQRAVHDEIDNVHMMKSAAKRESTKLSHKTTSQLHGSLIRRSNQIFEISRGLFELSAAEPEFKAATGLKL